MSTLRPKRSLGQNFLVDPNTARRIAESLTASDKDPVVEIGPGTGAVTGILLARYPDLIAIEVDRRAVDLLSEKHPGLDVRHKDVLAQDWCELVTAASGKLSVIGNLPYHLTSPILFSLLENAACLREAVLMMQLEVAQRLVAVPRTRAYGILSVATQLVASPEILFRVSRNVFRPRPKVTSAVVRLVFPEGSSHARYGGLLKTVVRAAFNQRRKKLRNSLSAVVEETGSPVPERWSGCRAEELTPEEFVELARYLGRAS